MAPVLIRKQFDGGAWATTLAATALVIGNLLSILWNEVYRRVSTGRYLLLIWLLAHLPLAAIAFCGSAGAVLACVFVSAIGAAATQPLLGDMLRSCYPPVTRSTVLGSLQSVIQFSIMAAAWVVGLWLEVDDQAFRVYFPLSVGIMSAGVWMLWRIACQPLFQERARQRCAEPLAASIGNAYRNMLRALAGDAVFRRFEVAYCAFNFAWLICVGLLPLLVTDVLDLNYKQVAMCSQVPLQLILVIGTAPVGFVMTRLGPIRMSVWALAAIAFYPVGLIFAQSAWHVGAAIVLLGICLTAINVAWTIGPVTLAPHPAQAPHYLAIHWTLTTLVGLMGQFPAVAYYRHTGDIYPPLAVAAGAYALSSVLMYRLERSRRTGVASTVPVAVPAATVSAATIRPTIQVELIANR